VGSFGETSGETVPALLELVPVVGEPLRDDLVWLPERFGAVGVVGEVAALGDGGDVGTVVGEDRVEHVRASAISLVSVMTWIRLSSRPRVTATYRPRWLVAGETRATATSTVSPWWPCSVAA
jgi:hypothetical protein